jgi:hypothetical protein
MELEHPATYMWPLRFQHDRAGSNDNTGNNGNHGNNNGDNDGDNTGNNGNNGGGTGSFSQYRGAEGGDPSYDGDPDDDGNDDGNDVEEDEHERDIAPRRVRHVAAGHAVARAAVVEPLHPADAAINNVALSAAPDLQAAFAEWDGRVCTYGYEYVCAAGRRRREKQRANMERLMAENDRKLDNGRVILRQADASKINDDRYRELIGALRDFSQRLPPPPPRRRSDRSRRYTRTRPPRVHSVPHKHHVLAEPGRSAR